MTRVPPPPNGGVSARREAQRRLNRKQGPKEITVTPTSFKPHYDMPEWAKVLNIHIRNTDAKAQAAVMQIGALIKHIDNLNATINHLTTQVARSQQLILRFLDDHESREHAAAIVKDFNISIHCDPHSK
jgi:hypothetical protein